ncbi:MAG: hypothetical protein GXO21_03445 [Aquificae bacterium]|nr:hypothetical protein [Aquificota bacterium]
MEKVQQLEILLDIDINALSEEELTDILKKAFEEKGYIPRDTPVVVREGKISSIRAIEKETQEEVELYTFAKVIKKDKKVKTYISARIV